MSPTPWFVVALLGLASAASGQTTWYVDDDTCPSPGTGTASDPFCSIQDGIVAAVDGDTVLVHPGTYFETIDFLGKAITVVAVDPDPTVTVIDASNSGPAASFRSGETSAAHLAGLTLTGGSGVSVGGQLVGGNLYVDGASPTLENLVVRDNFGAPDQGGGAWFNQSSALLDGVVFLRCIAAWDGGGLYAVDSSLGIDRCRFEACKVTSTGGGLYVASCASITIRDSDVTGGNQASFAGGLYAEQTSLDVSGCTFDGSIADENSAGGMGLILCDGLVSACSFTNNEAWLGYGGGVWVYGDTPLTIRDCEFRTNLASEGGSHIGVENFGGSSGPTFTGCRCSDSWTGAYVSGDALFVDDDFAGLPNRTGVSVHGPGAARFVGVSVHGFDIGISFYGTDLASLERSRVTDNLYTDLEAYDGSGVVLDCEFSGAHLGAYCDNADILFEGCTISGNAHPANFPGGLAALGASAPTLRNSIVRGNTPFDVQDTSGGHLKVEYSDVGGGWAGTGNVDVDPLFVDAPGGDFSLQAGSPCIDTGDPALGTTRRDLFGRPRRLDGALVRSERVDMGAFEFGQLTLAVSGNATPGGTLTIDTSGNSALLVFLIVGLDAAELDHKFLGTVYVDLSTALPLIPWSPAPSSIQAQVPLGIPVPLSIHLQEVGVQLANGAGATSNDVVVTVR